MLTKWVIAGKPFMLRQSSERTALPRLNYRFYVHDVMDRFWVVAFDTQKIIIKNSTVCNLWLTSRSVETNACLLMAVRGRSFF